MVFRPAAGQGFQVERTGAGAFAVRGRGIERLLQRYDIENEDAMAYLEDGCGGSACSGRSRRRAFSPATSSRSAG